MYNPLPTGKFAKNMKIVHFDTFSLSTFLVQADLKISVRLRLVEWLPLSANLYFSHKLKNRADVCIHNHSFNRTLRTGVYTYTTHTRARLYTQSQLLPEITHRRAHVHNTYRAICVFSSSSPASRYTFDRGMSIYRYLRSTPPP